MFGSQKKETADKAPSSDKGSISAPAITLPKGGGAIKGIGEKFAANPVTGTGSMTVPIATSPGRSGFGPQLSLSYDSGSGNGPFGFGWSLSIPSITRKTDKGLPKYLDLNKPDVFILSGAEDLVPEFEKAADGKWVIKDGKYVIHDKPRTVDGVTYAVRLYRPRIEGMFARIERWTKVATGEIHWRSITRDNVTTLYGKDNYSRIFDPADPSPDNPTRIFSWLICESYDDKGNATLYEYKEEDSAGIDLSQANEKNRTDKSRSANHYLKRINYGNKTPRWDGEDLSERTDWLFEVIFDYEEGHYEALPVDAEGRQIIKANKDRTHDWSVRQDHFSSYRAGFEVRTYRLCRRVLMFHHFPDELGTDDYLVRSTEFDYTDLDYSQPQTIEAELAHKGSTRFASFITGITQSGYVRRPDGTYLKKSLPPLEFTYSKAEIDETVHSIDSESIENLPVGLDGSAYQWVDLDGEGLSGILTEQASAWFYKRNLGGKFGPVELVATNPSLAALNKGKQQLLDLAGDGQIDLVQFEGPMSGYYERTHDDQWERFIPFSSIPNIPWNDPNLKFIDLTGDGHADVLISEDEVFSWYVSLAEEGFGPGEKIRQALDEEQGPRLVFADGTQSIYLSDMSGDGLTDLVRIRNGEVCYWANLGYGRFGAKVTMDNAPWFDYPDLFDQKRIRLADIDGSGVVDIIYLAAEGIKLYFNQSGNRWSDVRVLSNFPAIDNLSSVQAADLLGNGTVCLVWSSPLPGAARSPLRYIDLMGGQKPHLLVKTLNNLGAETEIQYAPSTKFYLADKLAGRPWITKLPFPVHVVEKVTAIDHWRNTRFASTYSYHHGYFDGIEREFRGFGRVEQVDVESFGEFLKGNASSPYITDDHELYQPPIKTITWYHTGAALDRQRILTQFQTEYLPNSLAALPGYSAVLSGFNEKLLPEPNLETQDLSSDEWREALRGCKGMTLRQEVYELDVDQLETGKQIPVRLLSTATHNCHICCLQPKGENQHAVFLVTESEALSYHYELDLRPVTFPSDPKNIETLKPDPRVAHTLNLSFDEYGNIQQTIAVGYKRAQPYTDPELADHLDLIHKVQGETHLSYTETHYTNDMIEPVSGSALIQHYRLRLPYEVQTYKLTGIVPEEGFYFDLTELRGYKLSDSLPNQGSNPVGKLEYHELPSHAAAQKRKVEHACTLFFEDDLTKTDKFLKSPLALGTLGKLGLTYETYKLALSQKLLDEVFGTKLTPEVLTKLNTATISGYTPGTAFSSSFTNQWWMRSGIAGFVDDPQNHFYLPNEYTDPFGNVTTLAYDGKYDLFIRSSTDALGNTTRVELEQFDYRVLAPREMVDINGNFTEAYFDILGMVVASAVKGKGNEGDDLIDFNDDLANPSAADVQTFCTDSVLNSQKARDWLGHATARFVYHFGERRDPHGKVTKWADRPAGACGIQREIHFYATGGADNPLQVALECSDGTGNVLMKKVQAEPDPALPLSDQKLRWIVNGLTVLNNKGKPVKQYEPAFSDRFGCELPGPNGVTPVMYYDAAGRLIRTEMPDGTFSRVEFSPWHVKTFDANDTVLESRWYREKLTAAERGVSLHQPKDSAQTKVEAEAAEALARNAVAHDKRAARLAALHADTPALTILDSLGREVIAIAHNRTKDAAGAWQDEKYLTFNKLDAEGKPLWIRDARGNLVMQYITPAKANNDPSNAMPVNSVPCYDIAGNLLFQHSMDAGDRWMLMDAAGKPILAWDMNETPQGTATTRKNRLYTTDYDKLHRPTAQWLKINDGSPIMVERYEYRDTRNPDGTLNTQLAQDKAVNCIGQLVRHHDPSGCIETIRRDFKGNVQEVHRTLNNAPDKSVIDWQTNPADQLESDTYVQITEHDAFNRMTRLYNWHLQAQNRIAIYEPRYNERGALQSEDLVMRATGYDPATGTRTTAIQQIRYNAKDQKTYLKLGNSTLTQYDYDPQTFRLRQLRTTRPANSNEFPQLRSNLANPNIIQQLFYTYDPVGNITEIEDQAYKPVFFSNAISEPKSRYEYDALYRLTKATGRENGAFVGAPSHIEGNAPDTDFPITDFGALRTYTQNYTYDPVGNIEHMEHKAGSNGGSWTRDYAYATDSNRLLSTQQGSETIHYGYDIHGNMLNLANVAPGQHLQWDHRDMIENIDLVGGGMAYYQYDTGKQRTRKRIVNQNGLGGYWERIYLGGYERYRRYNGSGSTLVEEIETHHLFEREQRVLLVDDVLTASGSMNPRPDGRTVKKQTLFRYQYSNHLGSACLVLDHVAGIISYEEYHPYGTSAYRAMKSGIEAPPKRYRYTWMERDEESGLNCHGVRYYAPWLGRWVNSDPYVLSKLNKVSTEEAVRESTVNNLLKSSLYTYCHSNPTNSTDRDGCLPWFEVPDTYNRVSSPFGNRVHPKTGGIKSHGGIDMPMPEGTRVRSMADGVVKNIGWQVNAAKDEDGNPTTTGAGLYVEIDHGNGLSTFYMHLTADNNYKQMSLGTSNSGVLVSKGEKVKEGQTIALSGDTGGSTGPHLHLEITLNGKKLDPLLVGDLQSVKENGLRSMDLFEEKSASLDKNMLLNPKNGTLLNGGSPKKLTNQELQDLRDRLSDLMDELPDIINPKPEPEPDWKIQLDRFADELPDIIDEHTKSIEPSMQKQRTNERPVPVAPHR